MHSVGQLLEASDFVGFYDACVDTWGVDTIKLILWNGP